MATDFVGYGLDVDVRAFGFRAFGWQILLDFVG